MKKKKSQSWTKIILSQLHLWLGLVAGLVVTLSMLGAAVYVWEEELTHWYYNDYVYVAKIGDRQMMPSELFDVVDSAFPEENFTSVKILRDPRMSVVFQKFKRAENSGWTWWSTVDTYKRIYVDPYEGRVLGVVDLRYDWIQLCRRLHQNLLLEPKVGELTVGIAALIMMILALSGLYLWWPKNKRMLKNRLKIKWKARWKRVNWDVHSVGGFYTHMLVLFFATTGLVWTFSWWTDGIYRILGNDPEEVFVRPEPPHFSVDDFDNSLDKAWADVLTKRVGWTGARLIRPAADKEEGFISVTLDFVGIGSAWDTWDRYAYHPDTGEPFWDHVHEEKLLGEKWRNSNYAMHVGEIYGWPTKVIAFLSALFFASLPITGFLIWWGKKKKKKRPAKRRSQVKKEPKKAMETMAQIPPELASRSIDPEKVP
ncbi:MAG: PepSY-associated TM helix domain-containing protein [Bacteroidota bacterium]